MTVASLHGCPGGGWMDYGRLTRVEIIKRARDHAAHQKAQAEQILAAPDDAFDCRIVRGVHVQHLIEKLT
jgi:hypothetical protein